MRKKASSKHKGLMLTKQLVLVIKLDKITDNMFQDYLLQ